MHEDSAETHVVAKLFPHPTRRFKIGDPISASDVADVVALDWADMKKRKFVVAAETKAAERVIEHADELQAKAEEKNANPGEPAPQSPPPRRR